jgi:hypothetical protein
VISVIQYKGIPNTGFTRYSITCPAYMVSPWCLEIVLKLIYPGVMVARFAGELKKSHASCRLMGIFCTVLREYILLIAL